MFYIDRSNFNNENLSRKVIHCAFLLAQLCFPLFSSYNVFFSDVKRTTAAAVGARIMELCFKIGLNYSS